MYLPLGLNLCAAEPWPWSPVLDYVSQPNSQIMVTQDNRLSNRCSPLWGTNPSSSSDVTAPGCKQLDTRDSHSPVSSLFPLGYLLLPPSLSLSLSLSITHLCVCVCVSSSLHKGSHHRSSCPSTYVGDNSS